MKILIINTHPVPDSFGIWNYCSLRDVTTKVFDRVNDDSPRELIEGYLVKAKTLARNLFVD